MSFSIQPLDKSEIHHLITGFVMWYGKNNSPLTNNINQTACDIFEASDTDVFKLTYNGEILGVFFLIEDNTKLEVGGGLIQKTRIQFKHTYLVFDYAVGIARDKCKKLLCLSVIKGHYKLSAITHYYEKYGFRKVKEDALSIYFEFNLL